MMTVGGDAEIKPISKIDPGELLLDTVRNADKIEPKLQEAIANFINIWATPIRMVSIHSDAPVFKKSDSNEQ